MVVQGLRSLFTFKAMGSRQRPPPAALSLPERGIGVGLWAADFDGPSKIRVEQLFLPSCGVQRLPVHVRHWRCGRLSERLRAAADAHRDALLSGTRRGYSYRIGKTTAPRP